VHSGASTGDGTLVCKEYPEETKDTEKYMDQMELDLCELQKEVADMCAVGALKQGQYHYAEDDGTLEVLKQGAGGHELQKRVDEMRELQTMLDDLRAGDKTLEALSLSHHEQMVADLRAMYADGSAGEVGSLEEQMTTLKKIVDEAMVLQEYEVCARGEIIKVHTAELEKDPNEVEGGKGDILNSEQITAEQTSVDRGLLDPGGGATKYMNPGEGQGAPAGGEHNAQARGGKIKDPGGGRNIGKIKDPGKGGNIDHEVPRKVYAVQKIKNRWGINEDAKETRRDEKVIGTSTASENSSENGPDETGSKGGNFKGSNEKENREEPKKKEMG
jgi:hypothetical protein